MQMFGGVMIHTLRPMEDHEHQTERIERGDVDTDQHGPIGVVRDGVVRELDRLDDSVLREKASEAREADQGQSTNETRPVGDGHVALQATHLAHVLLMMQADDDRTGRQEQQRFEEGMGKEMEDGRAVGRSTQCDGHVAQL